MTMKIALLGTGFGQAHSAVHAPRTDVDEAVVFGRTPEKPAQTRDAFGFATTTDLDTLTTDGSVDLVDICLPTRLHADVAIRALHANKDVVVELPRTASTTRHASWPPTSVPAGRRSWTCSPGSTPPTGDSARRCTTDVTVP
ncbi:MAG: Gfo/Idh/MocA family oxidoreductase [Nocardioidaceae bacterium]|nr:Gfo/Idh/MocA family oxidoreductase [Nocardioidaceae bacterium]